MFLKNIYVFKLCFYCLFFFVFSMWFNDSKKQGNVFRVFLLGVSLVCFVFFWVHFLFCVVWLGFL